jgi:hypothetical protein
VGQRRTGASNDRWRVSRITNDRTGRRRPELRATRLSGLTQMWPSLIVYLFHVNCSVMYRMYRIVQPLGRHLPNGYNHLLKEEDGVICVRLIFLRSGRCCSVLCIFWFVCIALTADTFLAPMCSSNVRIPG